MIFMICQRLLSALSTDCGGRLSLGFSRFLSLTPGLSAV